MKTRLLWVILSTFGSSAFGDPVAVTRWDVVEGLDENYVQGGAPFQWTKAPRNEALDSIYDLLSEKLSSTDFRERTAATEVVTAVLLGNSYPPSFAISRSDIEAAQKHLDQAPVSRRAQAEARLENAKKNAVELHDQLKPFFEAIRGKDGKLGGAPLRVAPKVPEETKLWHLVEEVMQQGKTDQEREQAAQAVEMATGKIVAKQPMDWYDIACRLLGKLKTQPQIKKQREALETFLRDLRSEPKSFKQVEDYTAALGGIFSIAGNERPKANQDLVEKFDNAVQAIQGAMKGKGMVTGFAKHDETTSFEDRLAEASEGIKFTYTPPDSFDALEIKIESDVVTVVPPRKAIAWELDEDWRKWNLPPGVYPEFTDVKAILPDYRVTRRWDSKKGPVLDLVGFQSGAPVLNYLKKMFPDRAPEIVASLQTASKTPKNIHGLEPCDFTTSVNFATAGVGAKTPALPAKNIPKTIPRRKGTH